jgi:hypothetical protein
MVLGPGWECADDIFARQHHEVIALSEDHQAWRRSDPADHVQHSIGMADERMPG